MKKIFLSIAVLLGSLSLFAQTNQELINKGKELTIKNGCTACHKEFGPNLAPGYAGVGIKYKKSSGEDAVTEIAKVIAKGSKGQYPKFKNSAMPPYAHLSEADRKAIATYIISLSK